MRIFPIPFLLLAGCGGAVTAAPLDLPARPGAFWPGQEAPAAPASLPADAVRFDSLAALTEHALRTRPDARAAWFGIQAEAGRLDAAEADNWPTLTGQFSFTRSQAMSSAGSSVPVLHRYGPSLSLAYVLYDFGARTAGIEAQRYQLVSTLLAGNRTLQDIVSAVETAYYVLVAARGALDAQNEQVASLAESEKAVRIRLEGGLASRADALRARAARVEAELAGDAAARDAAKAEAALKQAAGIAQTQTLALDWPLAPPPDLDAAALLADLLAEAERQRPDLRSLRASAAAARAEADRARAARWPSLALSANTGRTFFLEDERAPSTTYSIGLNLSVPLFDGGRLAAQARAAERDAERFAAQADAQRDAVALDVTQAWQDARYAQTARAGVAAQYESAAESARAAEARYKAGVGSLLEWLTAQADLARARQARVQADGDWQTAFSRLNHALGRLPAALPERQP